jgi:hypothetical protein
VERADDKVLSALAALQNDRDWIIVKEWIELSARNKTTSLTFAKDEVTARWMQGAVQELNEMLRVSNEAMSVMHRKRSTEQMR